jgi:hypothetical protein
VPAAIQQLARAKQEVRAEQLTPVEGRSTSASSRDARSRSAPAPPAAAEARRRSRRRRRPKPAEAGGYLNRLLDAKKKSQQKPKE